MKLSHYIGIKKVGKRHTKTVLNTFIDELVDYLNSANKYEKFYADHTNKTVEIESGEYIGIIEIDEPNQKFHINMTLIYEPYSKISIKHW